jgi:hypothetical protein
VEEFFNTVFLVVLVLITRFFLFLGNSFDTFFVMVNIRLDRWKFSTFLLKSVELVFTFFFFIIIFVFIILIFFFVCIFRRFLCLVCCLFGSLIGLFLGVFNNVVFWSWL